MGFQHDTPSGGVHLNIASLVTEMGKATEVYRRQAQKDELFSPAISREMSETVGALYQFVRNVQSEARTSTYNYDQMTQDFAALKSRVEKSVLWYGPHDQTFQAKTYLKELGEAVSQLCAGAAKEAKGPYRQALRLKSQCWDEVLDLTKKSKKSFPPEQISTSGTSQATSAQKSAWPDFRILDNSLADIQDIANRFHIPTDIGRFESRARAAGLCSELHRTSNPGVESFVRELRFAQANFSCAVATDNITGVCLYFDQLVESAVSCLMEQTEAALEKRVEAVRNRMILEREGVFDYDLSVIGASNGSTSHRAASFSFPDAFTIATTLR